MLRKRTPHAQITMLPAGGGSGAAPSVYVVTSPAEWAAVAALPASTLSGKTIEIQGTNFPSQLTMSSKSMNSALTIRGTPGARVPSLKFTSMRKLIVKDLTLQMTGWPRSFGGCLEFFGASADIKVEGNLFRHGYGPGAVDMTPAVIEAAPEILRTDNLITATTASSRIAILRSPANGPNWWIEFFNRGANPVHVRGGTATVFATTADAQVAPGGYLRLNASHTHVAVLAAAGTSLCNARAEVGISAYIVDAFNCDGGTTINNLEIVGNTFESVGNAVKAISNLVTGRLDIWKNVFSRVYMDLISVGQAEPSCKVSILLNSGMTPTARSGIAENLTGDARDPHGDLHQSYYNPNVRSTAGWFIAGNVYWPSGRMNATSQGSFISDNDGGYENVFSIANVLSGGSARGYSVGDAGVAASGYVFGDGDTIINPADPASASSVFIYGSTARNNAIHRTIAGGFPVPPAASLSNNITLGAGNTQIFANWAAAATATSKSAMLAALTTGQQIGAADLRASLIDEAATTPDAVIRWANTRPGLSWPDAPDCLPSTLYTSPLRKVLGGTTAMPITAFAGTEYQLAADPAGASILVPWTQSSGTVSRGQFVQLRGLTSSIAGASAGLGVSINAVPQPISVLTAEPRFTLAGDVGFADPAATSLSPLTGQLTFWLKLRASSLVSATFFILSNRSVSLDMVSVTNGGDLRSMITDSANVVAKASSTIAADVLQPDIIYELLYSIDMPGSVARLWINGVLAATTALTAHSGLLGSSSSKLHLLQSTSGTSRFVGQVFGLKVWRDIAVSDGLVPTAAPYKTLTGSAASANADPWKVGSGTAL